MRSTRTRPNASGSPSVARRAATVAAVIVVSGLPFAIEPFQVEQVTTALVLGSVLLALGLLTGFGGQISLGHGAFVGLGAYTTAILVDDYRWPHLLTILVAAALCFVFGLVVGLPALRISGLYLALVTLALAALFPVVLRRADGLTHGNAGINFDDLRAPGWTGLADDQWLYFVVVAITGLLVLGVRNLIRSRPGRAIIAVRDSEIAAEASGINIARIKTMTFGVSALIAGVAGSMQALVVGAVAPDSYGVLVSIFYLAGLVIGGVATFTGPVIGGFVLHYLPRYASDVNENLSGVIYGGALMVLMYVAPGGLVGLGRRLRSRLTARPVAEAARSASTEPAAPPDTAHIEMTKTREP